MSSSADASSPAPSSAPKSFSDFLKECASGRADVLGRGVCVQTKLAIADPNPGCSLRVLNSSLKPVVVPKAQFVSLEAVLRFIGELSKQYPDVDKKEVNALVAINKCGQEINKERGVAVVKISDKVGAFVGDCDNAALKESRAKYDADLKVKQDEAKEKEKAAKAAEKEKEKAAKAAEKEKAAKAKDMDVAAPAAAAEKPAKAKRAPKRKAEEVEVVASGSVSSGSELDPVPAGIAIGVKEPSPKATRVRKEKAPAKARDALGLDVDQAIGAVIEQDWDMAN